jgi:hypothetical protein
MYRTGANHYQQAVVLSAEDSVNSLACLIYRLCRLVGNRMAFVNRGRWLCLVDVLDA